MILHPYFRAYHDHCNERNKIKRQKVLSYSLSCLRSTLSRVVQKPSILKNQYSEYRYKAVAFDKVGENVKVIYKHNVCS